MPWSGRMVLVIVVLLLIVVFALTQYLVSQHRQTESALAKSWFARGERAMQRGYPAIAAEDYRTSLSYDRENKQSRLRLAEALLAGRHYQEARSHLLSMWDENPANGEVNLTLARLNAQLGDQSEAVRYYRNAINGVWSNDAREQRIATRFELVRYLLQQHSTQQAAAELIALQADPPQEQEIDRRLELGDLLLHIGEYARAQGVFESILRDNKDDARAWFGDGKASFALGDYRAAERELTEALEQDPNLGEAKQQLDLVGEILSVAPGLRGLSLAERARRVAQSYDAAFSRLTACASAKGYMLSESVSSTGKNGDSAAGQSGAVSAQRFTAAPTALQQLYATALQLRNFATQQELRKHPDFLESTMDFALGVERYTEPLCPDLSLTDRALLVLAKHQGESVQ